ncbi:hypothetical protein CISG_07014 [Coccidioides immitis RMSCC 3703]|uniref:Uncharacterized protein n=3 Tax=Coccidioides TaxID=5500 RepID=A0A0J8QZ68_COCIT|nr:hypothetical protein CPAG_02059 [Coccidioides posadasii RMSCC 3488]KMP00707.1 hypothetical protein CIRG_00849 [Coccidioides immitis RMSCC 2394]KMU78174.1 hypothetical protein CISG_07014 [Coccidioides immitis RMSCC 3703]
MSPGTRTDSIATRCAVPPLLDMRTQAQFSALQPDLLTFDWRLPAGLPSPAHLERKEANQTHCGLDSGPICESLLSRLEESCLVVKFHGGIVCWNPTNAIQLFRRRLVLHFDLGTLSLLIVRVLLPSLRIRIPSKTSNWHITSLLQR